MNRASPMDGVPATNTHRPSARGRQSAFSIHGGGAGDNCRARQQLHHPPAASTNGSRPPQHGERPCDDGNRKDDERHDESSRKADRVSSALKSKESAIRFRSPPSHLRLTTAE